jgi:hypothetical protein
MASRGNLFSIIILVLFFSFFLLRTKERVQNPKYIFGIVTRQYSGAKGAQRVEYQFILEGRSFKNSMPKDFFRYCHFQCCEVGDTVVVRYQDGYPGNNDLVKKLPD